MRPFCIATIGGILGIIVGLYFNSIVLFVVFLILMIFIVILIFVTNSSKEKKHIATLLIFASCFFIFGNYILAKENIFAKINQKYEKKEIEIQAIVITDKVTKEYKDVYQIRVTNIKETGEESTQNFKMILNLKKEKDKNIQLKYGDEICFKGIYEKPDEARNEGGFDYRQYLKTKDIAGITTVKGGEVKTLGKGRVSLIARAMHNIKRKAIEKIKEILPENTANLCTGLLIGDKTELSKEIQENFRNSNLSHLLAISGAHISYILLGVTTFIQKLKIHKRWSKTVIILFFIFFMDLTGFTPSVVRSCIMVILQLLASILFRKSDMYQNLAISCFIILLVNPYALLDIGFQLSFGGTIGIIVFSKKLQNIKNSDNRRKTIDANEILGIVKRGVQKMKSMCLVTLSANLVILPIMMYHFNTISFTFFISNLLASPILGISLILGMIFLIALFIPILAQFISLFLHPILQLLIRIAEFSSKIPFAQILVPTPRIWQIILYYFLLIIILGHKARLQNKSNARIRHKKVIIMVLFFAIISPYILQIIPNNQLTISFIDVGQGDSMLIQTSRNKTILIDGGGSEVGSFDVGEKVLIPYLLDKGIMSIDYMIFSHFDSDHCQGLLSVMEKLTVGNIIISKQGENSNNYRRFLEIVKKKKVKVIIVEVGDKITIDKQCYLSILFPEQELISTNILNNNSIVMKLVYQANHSKKFSVLLTGDIEAIAENKLIELYKNTESLQADILKVAHHRF